LEARRKVARGLETWFAALPDFLPSDALQEAIRSDTTPEKEILRLPSDFSDEARARLGLDTLARIEFELRCGQLYDALAKLRQALGLKSFLVRRKHHTANTQGPLLRSESEVERAGRHVRKWVEVYQRGWNALNILKGSADRWAADSSWKQLQELKESDCVMLSKWMDDHRVWRERGEIAEAVAAEKGQGKIELPWIWKMQFQVNEGDRDELEDVVNKWSTDGKFTLI